MSEPVPPGGPSAGVLSKTEILGYIGEVAEELAIRERFASLVMVGGSYLALHDLRESTMDVDSVTRLGDEDTAVIRTIADRHGLRTDWLNDNAPASRQPG